MLFCIHFGCTAQWGDNYMLYKVPTPYFQYPPDTTHSYYHITDCIPVLCLTVLWLFPQYRLLLLNPFASFPQSPKPPPL